MRDKPAPLYQLLLGPSGAGIFLREVQAVWPSVAPYVDDQMQDGARAAGLPTDAAELSST